MKRIVIFSHSEDVEFDFSIEIEKSQEMITKQEFIVPILSDNCLVTVKDYSSPGFFDVILYPSPLYSQLFSLIRDAESMETKTF